MSLPTWVPPATDRLGQQTIEAEVVDTPASKDVRSVTATAKVVAAENQSSRGVLVFTEADKVLLETQESVIEKYLGAFLLVGEALSIIKGRELQRMLDPK